MKSYFKFLSHNKLYSAINVIGLAVSLMFVILLGDYSWRQMSIDSWHKNADRISLIGSKSDFFFWPQAVEEVKNMCPEVESTCRILSQAGTIKSRNMFFKDKDNPVIMITDQSFFDFFDFDLKSGDRNTVLDAPDKCVITESLANILFPDGNALGKPLEIVGVQQLSFGEEYLDSTLVYNVSGIMNDLDRTVLPNETKIIVSMERYPQVAGYQIPNDNLGMAGFGECKALFMVAPGMDMNSKREIIQRHVANNYEVEWAPTADDITFTPLTDVLYAQQNMGRGLIKGEKGKWQMLLAVILAVLFFAVSNYINLTVAYSEFRAKEMGIRKLLGSGQNEISLKLMMESALMVSVTFLMGLLLAFAFQKDFVILFNGIISLEKDINTGFVCLSIAFIAVLSLVSAIAPSMQIASMNPIDIVKGRLSLKSKIVLSKVFITVQTVITVVMLVSVMTIRLQLNHLIEAPLGFNHENMFQVYVYDDDVAKVESELSSIPGIIEFGHMAGSGLTNDNSSITVLTNGDKKVYVKILYLDKKAFDLLGFQCIKDNGQLDAGYYLNQEALKQLELPEDTREFDRGRGRITPLSGVIKDFHMQNILGDVEPVMIRVLENDDEDSILLKTDGSKETVEQIKEALREVGLGGEGKISDIHNEIIDSFRGVRNSEEIVFVFTLIAIIISIMGFVGMSLFFIRQNRKQIGIRRVMGSTIKEVFLHMLGIFCSPILLSFFVAIPVAYHIMEKWLNGFSYRISQSPLVYVTACLATLAVALISVIVQIYKASNENPADSIKTE